MMFIAFALFLLPLWHCFWLRLFRFCSFTLLAYHVPGPSFRLKSVQKQFAINKQYDSEKFDGVKVVERFKKVGDYGRFETHNFTGFRIFTGFGTTI
jgi:hypothetical protein